MQTKTKQDHIEALFQGSLNKKQTIIRLAQLSTYFHSPDPQIENTMLYLNEYCRDNQALEIITEGLSKFSDKQISDWLPFICHIYSRCESSIILQYLQNLAIKSIPLYLRVRWSLSSYLENQDTLESIRNKLDMRLVNIMSMKGSTKNDPKLMTVEEVKRMIKKKQVLSNYVNLLNLFYCKIFKFSEQLQYVEFEERKKYLQQHISGLILEFTQQQQPENCMDICTPIFETPDDDSYFLVNFISNQSFPFSTKQRVPFKVVFQTINFQENESIRQNVQIVRKVNHNAYSLKRQKRSSLILPHSYFGQDWNETVKKITYSSPFGHLPSHKIHSYIIKSGDDMRQQHLAVKLLHMFDKIFKKQHLKLWVHPYQIIPYDRESGLIQFVDRTKTISWLKSASNQSSLRKIYLQIFGQNWETAVTNFTRSLAGYSLFQYIFQVKDRHNNNILVDDMGHIIHIDFSFIISNSPGNWNFEKAPFKLTSDYLELLEDQESDIFIHFKFLLQCGFKYLRKYKSQIMGILQMMKDCPNMKCFSSYDYKQIEARFHQNLLDCEIKYLVQNLVSQSLNSYSTSNYDRYQWYTNSIHS